MSAPDPAKGSGTPLLVVVDPVARLTDAESVRIARDVLCAGAPGVKVCLPEGPEDAERMLARRGSRRPVVIGDDRALLRAVQVLHQGRGLGDAELSVVPVGTEATVALARGLGLPPDVVLAARTVLAGVEHQYDVLVDESGGVVVGGLRIPAVPDPPGTERERERERDRGRWEGRDRREGRTAGRASGVRADSAEGEQGRRRIRSVRARARGAAEGHGDDDGQGPDGADGQDARRDPNGAYGASGAYPAPGAYGEAGRSRDGGFRDGDDRGRDGRGGGEQGRDAGGADGPGGPGGPNAGGARSTWRRACRSLARTMQVPQQGGGGRRRATAPQRLRVEADGELLADLDSAVEEISVSTVDGRGGGSRGLAEITVRSKSLPESVLASASASGAVALADPAEGLVLARARAVTVSGRDFHYRADTADLGPVRSRTWTVAPAALRLTLPAVPPQSAPPGAER